MLGGGKVEREWAAVIDDIALRTERVNVEPRAPRHRIRRDVLRHERPVRTL